MGKKRKNLLDHPPRQPAGSYNSAGTGEGSAGYPGFHYQKEPAAPNSLASTALAHQASNANNILATKFSMLEHMLTMILKHPATDAEWREALGPGGEQKADFIHSLKILQESGHLEWINSEPAVASMAEAAAHSDTAETSTTPSFTALPGKKWPPPLPQIASPALTAQVFTHPSHSSAQALTLSTASSSSNYNRLEFLGDSVLHYILTKHLFHRFPTHRENVLSGLRAEIECNQNLHRYCITYGLNQLVRIGKDAQNTGTERQVKFCADVFEAYLGALILDDPTPTGWERVERWLVDLVDPKIRAGEYKAENYVVDRGSKQKLYLLVAGAKNVQLEYLWEGGEGMNRGGYWMTCYLTGFGYNKLRLGRGWGNNKGDAQLKAAMNALEDEELIMTVKKRKDEYLTEMGYKKKGRSEATVGSVATSSHEPEGCATKLEACEE